MAASEPNVYVFQTVVALVHISRCRVGLRCLCVYGRSSCVRLSECLCECLCEVMSLFIFLLARLVSGGRGGETFRSLYDTSVGGY